MKTLKTAEEYYQENRVHKKLVASDFVITERHLTKAITEDRQSIVDKIKEMITERKTHANSGAAVRELEKVIELLKGSSDG